MLENVHEMFDFGLLEFRRARKKTYEDRMRLFRQTNGHYLTEMLEYVGQAEDKEAAAKELGETFSTNVYDAFAKRGKIGGAKNQDLCIFMIYYTFPALLLTQNENAKLLCDKLLEAWRVKFNNPNMSYGEYDTILGEFKEKIFGLF